jgi:branched-chain amino acid transport system ATP-binding protein
MRLQSEMAPQSSSSPRAEQNVKFLELADRVYTLDNGRIGFFGTVSEIHKNDALRRAYFGLK